MNEKIYEAIARMLREFGYPDVTSTMIAEVHDAQKQGNELPHGVIGMFAERYLDEAREAGKLTD